MTNSVTLALISIVLTTGCSRAVVLDESKNKNYALEKMANIEGNEADTGYFMARSRRPKHQEVSMQYFRPTSEIYLLSGTHRLMFSCWSKEGGSATEGCPQWVYIDGYSTTEVSVEAGDCLELVCDPSQETIARRDCEAANKRLQLTGYAGSCD